ncbi:MAG: hypothetical protein QM820_37285 [Minicystis sp.]
MLRRSAVLALLVACSAPPARPDPPKPPVPAPAETADPASSAAAAAALRAYYSDRRGANEPEWRGALQARPAYVVALLDRSLHDEHSGEAPWRATPFWGASAENPARELRGRVAAALGEMDASPARVRVARWFLEHEEVGAFQDTAFRGVAPAMPGEVVVSLLAPPHPNAAVVVRALEEAAKRGLPVEAQVLAALAQHHRPSIRSAAHAVAAQRGLPAPRPFDAAAAMQAEPVLGLMRRLDRLVLETPPPSAPVVEVARQGRHDETFTAWLLGEDDKQWTLLTTHGRRKTIAKDGRASLRTTPAEALEQRVASARKKGNEDFALSERGGLTGQFQGRGASIEEVLLARWLHAARRFDRAAAILLPALDTLHRDEDLIEVVRARLGDVVGEDMLVAFAGDRDYARAERVARVIVERFPSTRHAAVAARLAAELPRRHDDFGKLSLPTPAEWKRIEPGLSRARQIDFWVERLRLLNCFQAGQPGGVSLDEPQTREPQGMEDDASWGLRRGKTAVLNPWSEIRRMKLTMADVPELAAHLDEDWLMPTVSFWRDFHPHRNVDRTRDALAELIDEIAAQQLVDRGRLGGAERDQEIERIRRWAAAHGGRSRTELLLGALEDALQAKQGWSSVRQQARQLVELRERRAIALFRRFLSTEPSEFTLHEVLDASRRIDPVAARELGEQHLADRQPIARVEAALIVLAAGDKAAARQVLGEALEKEDRSSLFDNQFVDAMDALLREGSPASRAAALRVFANPKLLELDGDVRAALVRRALQDGIAEGLRVYERSLKLSGKTVGTTSYADPIAWVMADEIIERLGIADPRLEKLAKIERGPARVPAAEKWVREKLAELARTRR